MCIESIKVIEMPRSNRITIGTEDAKYTKMFCLILKLLDWAAKILYLNFGKELLEDKLDFYRFYRRRAAALV